MLSKNRSRFRLFDEQYYLESYPDVSESGLNPYKHFQRIGAREGRNPCAVFNTEYYLSQVGPVSGDPTEHYQTYGIASGAEPHPTFDREWYLENNPDVVADGADPLWHYFRYGHAEGRKPGPLWRMQFAGARRPLWRLAGRTLPRRALRLQFGQGDIIEPTELHPAYGIAVYMTAAQRFKFSRERQRYQDNLRAESGLTPNVVLILSNAILCSEPTGGVRARYDSGSAFTFKPSVSSQICDLGGGMISLEPYH